MKYIYHLNLFSFKAYFIVLKLIFRYIKYTLNISMFHLVQNNICLQPAVHIYQTIDCVFSRQNQITGDVGFCQLILLCCLVSLCLQNKITQYNKELYGITKQKSNLKLIY